MSDMAAIIQPKSDQLNADSLMAGPVTIKVSRVELSPGAEQPCIVHYENDDGKPYKPCKSMARVMVQAWGPDSAGYVGKSMALYRDASVTWGGMAVGGIRISNLSHIERDMVFSLTATKGKSKPFTVKPLKATVAPLKAVPVAGFDWTDFEERTQTACRIAFEPASLTTYWNEQIETRKAAGADDKDRAIKLANTVKAKIAELKTDEGVA